MIAAGLDSRYILERSRQRRRQIRSVSSRRYETRRSIRFDSEPARFNFNFHPFAILKTFSCSRRSPALRIESAEYVGQINNTPEYEPPPVTRAPREGRGVG